MALLSDMMRDGDSGISSGSVWHIPFHYDRPACGRQEWQSFSLANWPILEPCEGLKPSQGLITLAHFQIFKLTNWLIGLLANFKRKDLSLIKIF